MGYKVEIIFGQEQLKKHKLEQHFTDFENLINRKSYEFETLKERNAFYKGLAESSGWIEFEIINEIQTKSADVQETQEEDFDYWRFIEKYYPNYYHCDSVLLSDILTKKMHGEEMSESDEEYIKDWNVREELLELDKELLGKAFENYFNLAFPKSQE